MLSVMNFAVELASTFQSARASTHLVKWSIATMIYLNPGPLRGRGPTTSVDTVCQAKFGLTSRYVVLLLKGLCAWHSMQQSMTSCILKFIASQKYDRDKNSLVFLKPPWPVDLWAEVVIRVRSEGGGNTFLSPSITLYRTPFSISVS